MANLLALTPYLPAPTCRPQPRRYEEPREERRGFDDRDRERGRVGAAASIRYLGWDRSPP